MPAKTELEKFDRVLAQWRFPSDLDRLQSRNVVRGAPPFVMHGDREVAGDVALDAEGGGGSYRLGRQGEVP
jgi:hypothetical protein